MSSLEELLNFSSAEETPLLAWRVARNAADSRSLVATRDIREGEVVFTETAAVTWIKGPEAFTEDGKCLRADDALAFLAALECAEAKEAVLAMKCPPGPQQGASTVNFQL